MAGDANNLAFAVRREHQMYWEGMAAALTF
jgi:hypothetical protein